MSVLAVIANLAGKRRRTRTYDAGADADFVGYLEEYMSPVGTIISKLSNKTPGDAWVLIAGQSLLKADYADLYDDIGGQFGETVTTFDLPDLSDTYLSGVGTLAVGAVGGQNDTTLTTAQMPAHSHGVTDAGHTHAFTADAHNHGITDAGHDHSAEVELAASAAAGTDVSAVNTTAGVTGSSTTGITVDNETVTGSNASNTTGISVDSAGSGDSIDNRPASIGVYHFIKTRI